MDALKTVLEMPGLWLFQNTALLDIDSRNVDNVLTQCWKCLECRRCLECGSCFNSVGNACSGMMFQYGVGNACSGMMFQNSVGNACSGMMFQYRVGNACSGMMFQYSVENACSVAVSRLAVGHHERRNCGQFS